MLLLPCQPRHTPLSPTVSPRPLPSVTSQCYKTTEEGEEEVRWGKAHARPCVTILYRQEVRHCGTVVLCCFSLQACSHCLPSHNALPKAKGVCGKCKNACKSMSVPASPEVCVHGEHSHTTIIITTIIIDQVIIIIIIRMRWRILR